MRIAQIAPISERVPAKRYGGTERMVYELTEELVKRGHDVTLFASGDSITSAKLSSVLPVSLREANVKNPYSLNEWAFLHFGNAYKREKEFDIIHDHNRVISVPTASLSKTPVVMTMHEMFHESNIPLYKAFPNLNLVTISHSQAPKDAELTIKEMIYNGEEMGDFPFGRKHDGYLLFVGRMSMEKGVHHAITVAKTLDLPLIIAARVGDFDIEYYKTYIKPEIDNKRIKWIGEVDEVTRNELMSKAMCFLHPVTWPEPFGLTLIESMACGTPVIGFNNGSIPEVLEDKKSGFVVENVEQMIEAVKNIDSIDRSYCRKYALRRFSAKKMADRYEKLYEKIVAKQRLYRMPPFMSDRELTLPHPFLRPKH